MSAYSIIAQALRDFIKSFLFWWVWKNIHFGVSKSGPTKSLTKFAGSSRTKIPLGPNWCAKKTSHRAKKRGHQCQHKKLTLTLRLFVPKQGPHVWKNSTIFRQKNEDCNVCFRCLHSDVTPATSYGSTTLSRVFHQKSWYPLFSPVGHTLVSPEMLFSGVFFRSKSWDLKQDGNHEPECSHVEVIWNS